MNRQEFFSVVVPLDGYYCVAGARNGRLHHKFASSVEEIEEIVETLVAGKYDVYFACSSFKTKERSQDNAMGARSFWLDIDCGESKAKPDKHGRIGGYATQELGLEALHEFCSATGLPVPWVNNSGRGWHAFWMLDNDIPAAEWVVTADRLKAATRKYGLIADPAVTADSARILRVPGTLNYKDPSAPLDVAVHQTAEPVPYTRFKAILEGLDLPTAKPRMSGTLFEGAKARALDPVTQALLSNSVSRFSTIAMKSLKGTGCAQIKNLIQNQGDIDEPLWRAGLSIAWTCVDKDTAIHKLSNRHPEYDAAYTLEKAGLTKGPYRCDTFAELSPGLCEGCTLKLSSPIQIGKEIEEYDYKAKVEETSELPPTESQDVSPEESEAVLDSLVTYTPPFPYFRGKNGGLYRKGKDEDPDRLIYDYDIYITKRIDDPVDGMCAEINLHTPVDGHRRFVAPCSHINSQDKFRDLMSKNGVMANAKGMGELMQYHIDFVKELQRRGQKPDMARLQFGWSDKDTKFVIGNREISSKKVQYSPASSFTVNVIPFYEQKGSIEEWKKSFNVMVGDENSAQAFALMSTFGSPLIKFTGVKGAMISLVSNASGTGKTTILKLINSVWGHPTESMLQKDDTYMSKQNRLGVLNNICATVDEITNMRPEEVSDTVYSVTTGRGRNRMESSTNRERLNTTRWSLIAVTTGNSFLSDKLGALKSTPDGELMRLLEIEVKLADNPDAARLLEALEENYGLAGDIYIQYVLQNLPDIVAMIDKVKRRIIKDSNAQRKERHWVSVAASNIVGGVVAQKLGLHDYNMKAVYRWAVAYFSTMRSTAESHIVDTAHILGEFLNENISAYLVMDATRINITSGTHVVKAVHHRVSARYENDTNTLYVSKKEFKEYCVSRQMSLERALKECSADYAFVGAAKKRMAAGTGVSAPAVEVFQFRATPTTAGLLDA